MSETYTIKQVLAKVWTWRSFNDQIDIEKRLSRGRLVDRSLSKDCRLKLIQSSKRVSQARLAWMKDNKQFLKEWKNSGLDSEFFVDEETTKEDLELLLQSVCEELELEQQTGGDPQIIQELEVLKNSIQEEIDLLCEIEEGEGPLP